MYLILKPDRNGNSRTAVHWTVLLPECANYGWLVDRRARAKAAAHRFGGRGYRGSLNGERGWMVFQSSLDDIQTVVNLIHQYLEAHYDDR